MAEQATLAIVIEERDGGPRSTPPPSRPDLGAPTQPAPSATATGPTPSPIGAPSP